MVDPELAALLAPVKEEKGQIIAALRVIQEHYGYISPDKLEQAAEFIGASQNEMYGVASFYESFRFVPPGETIVKICLGTTCWALGIGKIAREFERAFDVRFNANSPDNRVTLVRLPCWNTCVRAPMVEVNGEVYQHVTPDQAREMIAQIKQGTGVARKGAPSHGSEPHAR